MNYAVIAKNNDTETANRINSFSTPKYIASLKPESVTEFLNNLGIYGRFCTWGFNTKAEADKFALDCKESPNGFLSVEVIKDDDRPWTTEKRHEILTNR